MQNTPCKCILHAKFHVSNTFGSRFNLETGSFYFPPINLTNIKNPVKKGIIKDSKSVTKKGESKMFKISFGSLHILVNSYRRICENP